MKQVISLGSGLGGEKFLMEVGDRKTGQIGGSLPSSPKTPERSSRKKRVASDARSEFLVQSTAVDRHNFKGSLGITLECLQALWSSWSSCRWESGCVAAACWWLCTCDTPSTRFTTSTRYTRVLWCQDKNCTAQNGLSASVWCQALPRGNC